MTICATTPLTAALYPPWDQRKPEAWKRGEIDWDSGGPLTAGAPEVDDLAAQKLETTKVKSILVYLRLDCMPTLLALVSLLGGKHISDCIERKHPLHDHDSSKSEAATTSHGQSKRPIEVHGVRLLELTDRSSSVMQVTEVDEYSIFDPVLNAFRVLGQLYNLAISGEVAVVPESSYAETLVNKAVEESSDLLILPWSETGSISESQAISSDSVQGRLASDAYFGFVRKALDTAQCNVAVFINKGFSGSLKPRPSSLKRTMSALSLRSHRDHHPTTMPSVDRSHHNFLPFFGGADGRVALRLVLQLAENPEVTATTVHFDLASTVISVQPKAAGVARPRSASRTQQEDDAAFFATMQRSLADELQSRAVFKTRGTLAAMDAFVEVAEKATRANLRNSYDLVVVSRSNNESDSCLGDAADAIIASGVKASLLAVQARCSGSE